VTNTDKSQLTANRGERRSGGARTTPHSQIPAPYRGTAATPQSPEHRLLAARGLRKSYWRGIWPKRREVEVLRGADVELGPGEIIGLVGENGSGKSTLLKILVGTLERDAGEIDRPTRLGYCPQEPVLYERLTCDEHFDLFGRAYGVSDEEVRARSAELYRVLNFGSYADVRVDELSGGTQAKLNLALVLLPRPEVLLLDEAYAGFDWDTYLRFWDLAEEQRNEGRAILIISHFLTDEDRFDRIYDLIDGVTVAR